MNIVCLIGRVTKDIVLTKTQSNKSKANFTLAINRDENHTNYIFCTAYGKRAEVVAQYVKKGNLIGVKGQLDTWSTEKDRRFEYGYSVTCDEIQFLERKNGQQVQKETKEEMPSYDSGIQIDDSDLPF